MNNRKKILEDLINYTSTISLLSEKLLSLSWDSDVEIEFHAKHLIHVLTRFQSDTIQADEVEQWANLIENREDIKFSGKQANLLSNIIFELANPELNQPLDKKRITVLLSKLSS